MLSTRDASNGAFDVLAQEAYVVDWVAGECYGMLIGPAGLTETDGHSGVYGMPRV